MNCLVHTVRVSRNNTRTAPADTFFEKKKDKCFRDQQNVNFPKNTMDD